MNVKKKNTGRTQSTFSPCLSRAYWEELEAAIGLVDEPFQVALIYSGCPEDDEAPLAIDSLELVGCEGEFGEMNHVIELQLQFIAAYFQASEFEP